MIAMLRNTMMARGRDCLMALLPSRCCRRYHGCEIEKLFTNRTIFLTMDITFRGAGDWATDSYATSGFPGACQDRLMDPRNVVVRFSSPSDIDLALTVLIIFRLIHQNAS
ncbi:hypothetical protein BKA70DRAFT_1449386 [Coprinopsis sp. MPI-PUGE-AT-0042]|nr:hypothetical protein BKA70DRAFT_1449386 [Coprinopsis sp. MPI-PUGE-AT-0042]